MKQLNRGMMVVMVFAISLLSIKAQDYSISVSNPASKVLMIKEVNRVSVEEYDGSEIQVSQDGNSERSERAEGLAPLSSRGKDNTGIGLNANESSDEITLFQVARREQGVYKVKVPKGMRVMIEHTGNWEGGEIKVYGISSELEIAGRYNSVYMEDVTGPALVNTVYGSIEAKFSSLSQNGPTSLVSVYDDVDVTLPANTKANIVVRTPYGEAYSDMNIEFDDKEGMRKVSSTIQGKLNGGGVDLEIKASYDNVYLRKN